ncbi:hypothetical protein A1Q1_02426 [Trichosporon asahii var. asahii CBS 2479]|uniref:CFEM domain-containing protein n=1 Tax=Trichosporon asahii var. asahii (strain ATCC 90039 / CBS 2479 / JCM 2466 / KCTC 7840 / NBRC 103889/ NCYC 2677 / UAMH 7654) TaxID=1186058 RepID=J5QQ94_TRIAS|nr:hypothetical protein A1Q1_02426 [Trichosporon asahii var. asahii CBS 2479]EJT48518.1 hypothetical protein A1Q1_02426 [Trichosporon asahii var. asahii CBS 2479]
MKFWAVALTAVAATSSVKAAGLLSVLNGLNDCLQYCLIDAAAKTKCSSIDDLSCICGSAFQSNAAVCLTSYKSCKPNDLTDALKLQADQCKALSTWSPTPNPPFPQQTGTRPPLPPVPGLSKCASDCLNENGIKWNCKDANDVACVCTDPFMNTVTPCILGCGVEDTSPSEVPTSSASPSEVPTSSATPSEVPTSSASPSEVPTSSVSPSEVPTSSASPSEVPTSSATPSEVPTSSATPTTSDKPSEVPTSSGTPTSSNVPTSSASQSATPTSGGPPGPTSSAAPPLDLSKLSPCALGCIVNVLTEKGCKGPADTECLCQASFTNAAATCLMAKCTNDDIRAALDLQNGLCPNMGLPNLKPLDDCTLTCVLKTLKKAGCSGPLDKDCLCRLSFTVTAGLCLAKDCAFDGIGQALELNIDICRGSDYSTDKCQATGIWRITDPRCWFRKAATYDVKQEISNDLGLVRRGPVAAQYARLLEANQ